MGEINWRFYMPASSLQRRLLYIVRLARSCFWLILQYNPISFRQKGGYGIPPYALPSANCHGTHGIKNLYMAAALTKHTEATQANLCCVLVIMFTHTVYTACLFRSLPCKHAGADRVTTYLDALNYILVQFALPNCS
jgi:hypothetical protein